MTTAPVLGSLAGTTRSAGRVLTAARELVEPAHRAAVDRLPQEIRHVAGYHVGWWDADGRPCDSGGKSVRPALVLASAWAVGGENPRVSEMAIPAAVAVELVHDFSLLHDDIMDGDLTRRHRPAAWTVFGTGETILVGDVLLALSLDLLATSPGLRVMTGSLLRLCSGQSADLAFETRTDVTLSQCVQMAMGKTGALLGCACELGALAGGADHARARLFGQFGRHLGLAFQLADDLLGIWGDPEVTGKPVFSDLANRKKSLPVVAALTSGTAAGERLASLYHRDRELDERDLARAADLVEAAGARAWARREAEANLGAALDRLREAAPAPGPAEDLRLLAHMITRRDH
ncbi:polyprenyl synthetase family protein [Streptosporangium sp. H16]|uniref:polyprenyl synthetase family protein n=1 Tax=Streptosporangium sp. H16 TaxID=3444184 RepID=UPI003F79DFC6